MNIVAVERSMTEAIAPMVAEFRTTLCAFRGIEAETDTEAGAEEIEEFLEKGYPIYAAADGDAFVGYMVLRTEEPCLWVEHLYVCDAYRRKGIASMLFEKAEELANAMGEDTVYNFVHPNNEAIIGFLRSKGYTVLNLIEVRKPYRDEDPKTTIRVGDNTFRY